MNNTVILKIDDMMTKLNKKSEKPFKYHEVNKFFVRDLNLKYKKARMQTINTNI